MRIGEFAKHNKVTIDTIRHYMSLGLIIPEKIGSQYEFDAQCQMDLDEVTSLKDVGFSLNEIHQLMLFQRIGMLTGYDKRLAYKTYFTDKLSRVESELKQLSRSKTMLEGIINEITLPEANHEKSHLTFELLSILACPICHQNLTFYNGQIEQRFIKSGVMTCSCGYEIHIDEGILVDHSCLSNKDETEEMVRTLDVYSEQFIDGYIKSTDLEYLKKLHSGLQWSRRHNGFNAHSNAPVILEVGSGHGFFIRHLMDQIPVDSLYIAIDHDLIKLKWLKSVLERAQCKFRTLFICTDFLKIPIQLNSVDLVLDISGSSNHAFESETFLLESIEPLLKKACQLHGYYILFERFSSKSKVELPYRALFNEKVIMEKIIKLGFQENEKFISESVEKGGPMEDFFIEGERVYTLIYNGYRK